jgi:V/A-type H+-transporting ATPase subunit E
MTDLEKADSRIQVICEKIRSETLDPAKEQAQEIIEHARREAERLLLQAHRDADEIKKQARKSLEEEKQIFQSSLQQSCKQTIELLKQKIEQSLFNPSLDSWVKEQLNGEKSHALLIEVLVKAIEKEGLQAELSVKIPQSFSADAINAKLSEDILKHLKNHSVELSDIGGGVQVKISGKNMVLDLSLEALEELVRSYIHKDFRKVFFGLQ